MAIRGSLKEASLPDVLQLLAMGKKSGCLSVAHRTNFGYIYFDKGRISYASVVNRRDRLGDLLVKNGVITQAQLDASITVQERRRDKRLGELLVEQRALPSSSCTSPSACRSRKRCISCSRGVRGPSTSSPTWSPKSDYLVSINPESLLLEGARRVDEWGLIEKKIRRWTSYSRSIAPRWPRPSSRPPTRNVRSSR
jgi:hypothetical protein